MHENVHKAIGSNPVLQTPEYKHVTEYQQDIVCNL